VHELNREKAQSVVKKRSVGERVKRHGERDRNRSRGFVHMLSETIARLFPSFAHGFENLSKEGMYSKSKEHNRRIVKQIRSRSFK